MRRRTLRWYRPPPSSHRSTGLRRPLVVHAGPPVGRPQQRCRVVGDGPAVPLGEDVEPRFHVPAGDGVERARQPVAEAVADLAPVQPEGGRFAVRVGGQELRERLPQQRHPARGVALRRGVVAHRDPAQHLLRNPPGPVGRHGAVASDHHAPVGRPPATGSRPVVDDERLGPAGLHPHAEAGQPVVPGDPGAGAGLQGFDGPLGEGQLDPGDALSRWLVSWRYSSQGF